MTPRALAEQVCRMLREAGYQAYFVGGCVRDLLLGREPADYDVTTDATPDKVQQLFPRSLAVGAKFGVVIVMETVTQTVTEDAIAENSASGRTCIAGDRSAGRGRHFSL